MATMFEYIDAYKRICDSHAKKHGVDSMAVRAANIFELLVLGKRL